MVEQQPLNAFCAYAQEDLPLWEELRCHLSVLQRQGLIASWYSWKFDEETESAEVDEALSHAQIILFFINSKTAILQKKINQAIKMREKGTALVFPILSSDREKYRWTILSLPIFKQLTFFPSQARALTSWGDMEEALCAQTRYILSLAQSYQAVRSLPERQRLKAIRDSDVEARKRALSEWSGYQTSNLGHLYYRQGKYAQAEPLNRRLLVIKRQQFGSKHKQGSDMTGPDRPPRLLRYSPAPPRSRFILSLIALVLVLSVVGMTVFINQNVNHKNSVLIVAKTPTPTPTPTSNPVLTPSPAPTPTQVVPTCPGFACDGKDPRNYLGPHGVACWNDGSYVVASRIVTYGVVYLWYSSGCGTNWSETLQTGGTSYIANANITRSSDNKRYDSTRYASDVWTAMVYSSNVTTNACGSINNTTSGCTGFI